MLTASELIGLLSGYPPDREVMILDSFNGGGSPREINLGPTERTITERDAEESSDCEELVGEKVIVLGWGCY